LNRVGDNSVQRTVYWMFLRPRRLVPTNFGD